MYKQDQIEGRTDQSVNHTQIIVRKYNKLRLSGLIINLRNVLSCTFMYFPNFLYIRCTYIMMQTKTGKQNK